MAPLREALAWLLAALFLLPLLLAAWYGWRRRQPGRSPWQGLGKALLAYLLGALLLFVGVLWRVAENAAGSARREALLESAASLRPGEAAAAMPALRKQARAAGRTVLEGRSSLARAVIGLLDRQRGWTPEDLATFHDFADELKTSRYGDAHLAAELQGLILLERHGESGEEAAVGECGEEQRCALTVRTRLAARDGERLATLSAQSHWPPSAYPASDLALLERELLRIRRDAGGRGRPLTPLLPWQYLLAGRLDAALDACLRDPSSPPSAFDEQLCLLALLDALEQGTDFPFCNDVAGARDNRDALARWLGWWSNPATLREAGHLRAQQARRTGECQL